VKTANLNRFLCVLCVSVVRKMLPRGGLDLCPSETRRCPHGAIPSPESAIPSWAWPPVQSLAGSIGIAAVGSAIPLRRCLPPGLAVFPIDPSRGFVRERILTPTNAKTNLRTSQSRDPLFEFRRPPRSFHGPRVSRPLGHDASRAFVPYGTHQPARSGSPGRCLPGTFRPQGLITLSTACSLAGPARVRRLRQRLWG